MRYKKTTLILAAMAMIAAMAPTASAIEPNQRVDLKVLLITDGLTRPSFNAWEASLEREGVPYDVFDGSVDTLEAADLEAGPAHARYQAVVCATECSHALTTDEILILDAYQTKYGIRRVSGYVFPNARYGMSEVTASMGDTDMSDQSAALTAAGLGVFPYLNGPIAFGALGSGWLQAPSADPNLTTLIAGPDFGGTPATLMGVYDRGGFEDLFLTFDSNAFQIQTLLLYRGLINWVTDGTYLGYGRNYFTMQIDDIFMATDRWDTEKNCTPGDRDDVGCADVPSDDPIRMLPADVTRALQWQTETGLRFDFVYNGAGSVQASNPGPDPLTDALLTNKDSFRWINHTYTHQNLDLVDQATIEFEIRENFAWAESVGLLPNLNVTELVTGEHSGLRDTSRGFAGNPAMPAALTATGIRWVGSDNSRTPDQESLGSALTVPRYPANVFYNTATQAELLDEYNWIYYESCVPITGVTTCLSAPLSWAQYVDVEATIMLPHLLNNDPRPHYFHQANLAEQGVFYSVVDEVLARYDTYFNTVLDQPAFADSGRIIQRATAWTANQELISAYLFNGSLVIENQGVSPINVPITGDGGETYGGTTSEWRTIAPSTVTPAPTVAVSGPNTAVVGESATFTVDTTGGVGPFGLDAACGGLGTIGAIGFDVVTGDGSFECNFGGAGSSTVSATVSTPFGEGTGAWTVTVSLPSEGGGGDGGVGDGGGDPEVLGLVNTFIDDDGNFHEPAIETIAALGITIGCNASVGNLYCPERTVTRGEMAAFIIRALGETGNIGTHKGYFPDVPASAWYGGVVERLFELGITIGNADGTYAPNALMTRAEMAAFLERAFVTPVQLVVPTAFADVRANAWYAESLQQIYAAGITTGCEVSPLRYCPDEPVRRDAMASFIARGLGLGN